MKCEIRDWTSSYLLRFQIIILVPFFPMIASSSASNFSSVGNKECDKMAFRLFLDSVGSLICRKHYVNENNFELKRKKKFQKMSKLRQQNPLPLTGSHSTSQISYNCKDFNTLV